VLDEGQHLLAELPRSSFRRPFELWKQILQRRIGQAGERHRWAMRYLLIRLSEHWGSYRVFDWDKDVPWTNNGTEQAIGHMQMRSRTVRGYKSWLGLHAAFFFGFGCGLVVVIIGPGRSVSAQFPNRQPPVLQIP
jgi:hypothetical protein